MICVQSDFSVITYIKKHKCKYLKNKDVQGCTRTETFKELIDQKESGLIHLRSNLPEVRNNLKFFLKVNHGHISRESTKIG